MIFLIFVFCSGLGMAFAVPPTSFYGLAWVAIVPLWYCIAQKKTTFKEAILAGLLWGLGYYGWSLSWILGVHPMTWMGVPWLASLSIALFCWIFITIWGSLIAISWSIGVYFIYYFSRKRKPIKSSFHLSFSRILISIAFWCVLEWIWSQGDLWWSAIALTQSPNNLWLLQLEQFSGISTVTFCLLLVNGLITEGLLNQEMKPLVSKNFSLGNTKLNFHKAITFYRFPFFIFTIIVLIFSHLIGFYYYQLPLENSADNALQIGLIQGNIPNEIKLYKGGLQKAIEGYTQGYEALARQGVDIVLTPETALPFYFEDIQQHSSFYQAILDQNVPVMLGTFYQNKDQYFNSLFMIDKQGKVISRFNKIQLVPLGEYIPFQSILGNLIQRLSPLDGHLQKGDKNQTFKTPFGQAIVGICYESAFSEHFRRQAAQGGEFIITASNDAHYSSSMLIQHHAVDLMRGIETNRWVARATNTGYSAIVNPRGDTLWLSDKNTYQLHKDTIYTRQTKTLYVQWGDWLTKVLLILGISSYFGCLNTLSLD